MTARPVVSSFEGWPTTTPDPRARRKTLAAVTEQVKLERDRRRPRSTANPLNLALADADPVEREQLAAALERLHELLVGDHRREVRRFDSERGAAPALD